MEVGPVSGRGKGKGKSRNIGSNVGVRVRHVIDRGESCYDCASWTIIFFHLLSPPPFPSYCTMDTLPSLLVIALSWTYLLIPRLGQDALRTVHPSPYLLHALPSPLLYYLHMHQYLLMRTLCTPFVPVSPHCCLMYHCTFCACFLTP